MSLGSQGVITDCPLNYLLMFTNSTIRRLKTKKVRSLASPEKKKKKKLNTWQLWPCPPAGQMAVALLKNTCVLPFAAVPTAPCGLTARSQPFAHFHLTWPLQASGGPPLLQSNSFRYRRGTRSPQKLNDLLLFKEPVKTRLCGNLL